MDGLIWDANGCREKTSSKANSVPILVPPNIHFYQLQNLGQVNPFYEILSHRAKYVENC